MIGPLGRLGAAATLGQHCPQMTQRRCKGQNERLVEKLKKIRDKTSPLCHVKGQKSQRPVCWTVEDNVDFFFQPHPVKELGWDKMFICDLILQLGKYISLFISFVVDY